MNVLLDAATSGSVRDGASERSLDVGGRGGLARALDESGASALRALVPAEGEVVLGDDEVCVRAWLESDALRTHVRWSSGGAAGDAPRLRGAALVDALHTPEVALVRDAAGWRTARVDEVPHVPAMAEDALGSPGFRSRWGVRASWMAGAMAGGIASVALVRAMRDAGFLASFGAGGLGLAAIDEALAALAPRDHATTTAFNLLHSPAEPALEEAIVTRYVAVGVRLVEASAFMGITPALARWRLSGLREEDGRVVAAHGVLAKISRPEVAEPFLRPAPTRLVEEPRASGAITAQQAAMAARVPMADDLTVEADSGGHTDRRPLVVMVPVIRRLADRVARDLGHPTRVGVGAAGGLGDPWSIAAALAMGADHVVTGSVNQACLEAGTSDLVKAMLAEAGPADVTTCPAPDMFELGAEVQVLARGSLYPQRARQLRELYRSFGSLEEIPVPERERLERQVFQQSLGEAWSSTRAFWLARDPREVERAERDPRHRMALVFRSYLGLSSRWARGGDERRKRDFQVWCGPAIGLFNDWTRGSALAAPSARGVVAVNRALHRGARVAMRIRLASLHDPSLAGEPVRVALAP